ncbi:OPS048 [Orgyia pseudotsugata single capsid nuclopolyhedrovirus]|nr:OPS048 [Orgyia pseudotsugata single capsid nuclopolyhedrovirus]
MPSSSNMSAAAVAGIALLRKQLDDHEVLALNNNLNLDEITFNLYVFAEHSEVQTMYLGKNTAVTPHQTDKNVVSVSSSASELSSG